MIDANILIVDDDRDVLLAARMLLKQHYQNVRVEADPAQIPGLMATRFYDAILLDIYMPVLSGRDTFKELRAMGNNVPVVVCSGFVIDPDEFVILSQGHPPPVDIMLKPYSLDSLSKALAKAINHDNKEGQAPSFELTVPESAPAAEAIVLMSGVCS